MDGIFGIRWCLGEERRSWCCHQPLLCSPLSYLLRPRPMKIITDRNRKTLPGDQVEKQRSIWEEITKILLVPLWNELYLGEFDCLKGKISLCEKNICTTFIEGQKPTGIWNIFTRKCDASCWKYKPGHPVSCYSIWNRDRQWKRDIWLNNQIDSIFRLTMNLYFEREK